VEGEAPDIALDRKGGRVELAGLDGPPDIVARPCRNAQRHVRRDALAAGAHEAPGQVDLARQAGAGAETRALAGTPGGAQVALDIGVGKLRLADLELDGRRRAGRARLHAPVQAGRQLVQRHRRLLEHAGEDQGAAVHRQTGLTAGLAGLELDVGARQSWPAHGAGRRRRQRGESQALDTPLGPVARRRVERALPADIERAGHARRRQLGQCAPRRVTDRQARGDGGHQRQVEPARAQAPAGHGGRRGLRGLRGRQQRLGLLPGQRHVARRPDHAVARGEAQLFGRGLHTRRIALDTHAGAQLAQGQRVEPAAHAQRDVGQRDVGRQFAPMAGLQLQPGACGAAAVVQVERQADVLAQLGHIGCRQVGEQRAGPAPPVAAAREQRLRERTAQRKALAPGGRRRGIQPHLVPPQAVAQHHVHIAQLQRRRLAQLVGPAQHALADDDLLLREQPVGRRTVVGRCIGAGLDVDPGDADAALRVAPHVELHAVDVQLRQAQLQCQQRLRRQRRAHRAEGERRLAGRVEHTNITQVEGRYPAAAAHGNGADAHRLPQGLAGLLFDRRTPCLDAGQNPPMQRQPSNYG
jgi:hypothetical protein